MFRKKEKSTAETLYDMLKERPLEIHRDRSYLAMYAPGIDKVVMVFGRNSHMSEGECLKALVLATRSHHTTK